MTLERLDAIATGVVGITAAGVIVAVCGGMFWETLDQAWRQQEVLGTVVAQESTKICQKRPRGRPLQCDRWGKKDCPIVQYQPETGEPIKMKDCSLQLSVGAQVNVVYDGKAPADARISLEQDLPYQWFPVFIASVPIAVAGLLFLIGVVRLRDGIQNRN
ncbi:MAG: DUF3592 domain-containing protein [Leptolyngbyaceae cyanobacterium bins.302]|nr:DUF3592 domain-containing protein [Leptolyngbyaceae cyanobacterium bins.302]